MTPNMLPGFKLELAPEVAERASQDIASLLRSAQHLTMGAWGDRLEQTFAQAVGTKHAVAVATGTAALEILLRSADVTGKEVIVPSNTFGATVVAVLRAGGTPVFCDIAPRGLVAGRAEIEEVLSSRTGAVVVVHIGGVIDDSTEEIGRLCADRRIPLIEDAAHATGSTFDGKGPGSYGVGAGFSFFNTKVLSTGEGGMLATNSDDVADLARLLRDHAKDSLGGMATTGGSWRLTEPTAVLGVHQLAHLPLTISGRNRVAMEYVERLCAAEIEVLTPGERCASNWYKVIVRTPRTTPAVVERALRARGIQLAGRVYAVPCHRQEAFRSFVTGPLPNTDTHAADHVCLPIHSTMTGADVERVTDVLREILDRAPG